MFEFSKTVRYFLALGESINSQVIGNAAKSFVVERRFLV